MQNNTIVFVVEGDSSEYNLVENMTRRFFVGKYDSVVIQLPIGQNCYMLWQKLKADNFYTDIIEIIREIIPGADKKLEGISRQKIDQVFMFFDLEPQQDNLPTGVDQYDVLKEMLDVFNNETEHGKLYISYPMIEATRDFVENDCTPFTSCNLSKKDVEDYKNKSGDNNPNSVTTHYTIDTWKKILNVFSMRIACLFDKKTLTYEEYKGIEPVGVFNQELLIYLKNDMCFVLSALPEFLFDYFNNSFWKTHAKQYNRKKENCDNTKNCP